MVLKMRLLLFPLDKGVYSSRSDESPTSNELIIFFAVFFRYHRYIMFDYAALSDNELQALASGGESAAEEALVKRYLPLVQACAWPMKLFGGEKKDLAQEGVFGLISAVRSFDPDNGASFRTYAEHCIRMRLLSAVKSASRLKHFPLNDSMSLEQLSEESDPRLSAVLEAFHRNPEDMVLARESKEEL